MKFTYPDQVFLEAVAELENEQIIILDDGPLKFPEQKIPASVYKNIAKVVGCGMSTAIKRLERLVEGGLLTSCTHHCRRSHVMATDYHNTAAPYVFKPKSYHIATTASHRGHGMHVNHGWRYNDTEELVSENKDRDCGYCGLANTPEGHDGCLGTLPRVMNACCGHGVASSAYIQFMDLSRISGQNAISTLELLKRSRIK